MVWNFKLRNKWFTILLNLNVFTIIFTLAITMTHYARKREEFVDVLSRGMKQRLCVARALIHDPELLILDEPNSGLDPRARVEMKGIMKKLRELGKTVVISSHILPELSEMCTSIGIIDHGRIVSSGKVDDIMAQGHAEAPVKIRNVPGIVGYGAAAARANEVIDFDEFMDEE